MESLLVGEVGLPTVGRAAAESIRPAAWRWCHRIVAHVRRPELVRWAAACVLPCLPCPWRCFASLLVQVQWSVVRHEVVSGTASNRVALDRAAFAGYRLLDGARWFDRYVPRTRRRVPRWRVVRASSSEVERFRERRRLPWANWHRRALRVRRPRCVSLRGWPAARVGRWHATSSLD